MSPQQPARRFEPHVIQGQRVEPVGSRNAYQAFQTLRWGFVAAPLIAGLDKFFHLLVNWNQYLSPLVTRIVPISPTAFMDIVGVIEIAAAALVAMRPRIGAPIVAAWLIGIIINLFTIPAYYDIALRDFGLFLGAVALSRLSRLYDR